MRYKDEILDILYPNKILTLREIISKSSRKNGKTCYFISGLKSLLVESKIELVKADKFSKTKYLDNIYKIKDS